MKIEDWNWKHYCFQSKILNFPYILFSKLRFERA
jgi:hypothetical protein